MRSILLFIASSLILAGCSTEDNKSRKPGSAPKGFWYTGSSDACTFDGIVYQIDSRNILLHTQNYEENFFSYSWNIGKKKDQLILTLNSLIESAPEPIIVHFLDQGSQLLPTEAYAITGEVVGIEKILGLLTLTACSDPSWFGSLRLLAGIDKPYLSNIKREPMPKPPQ